ncbi:MAG TPA: PIN domain-containing protein [Terriglobia bacterium]|nr:PIN domain-containing protein [Terriglobia bacterium]
MGLILDSSVIIAAERRGESVEQLIERILRATGDQDAALSAVGLTELVHGIYRASTAEIRFHREAFLNELLADLTVYPYTRETALLAGKLDGEQQSLGIVIPFADLLIGATALALSYSVLTDNVRHFERIPGLSVVKL